MGFLKPSLTAGVETSQPSLFFYMYIFFYFFFLLLGRSWLVINQFTITAETIFSDCAEIRCRVFDKTLQAEYSSFPFITLFELVRTSTSGNNLTGFLVPFCHGCWFGCEELFKSTHRKKIVSVR